MTRALTVTNAAAATARSLHRVCLDREVQEMGAELASRRNTAQHSTTQHGAAQCREEQSRSTETTPELFFHFIFFHPSVDWKK